MTSFTPPLIALILGLLGPSAPQDREDPVQQSLARVDRGGLASVWSAAQDLADLGDPAALRSRLGDASPLGRLALGRALLDLEAVPDARSALLALADDGEQPFEVRAAAVDLLGSQTFLQDRKATRAA